MRKIAGILMVLLLLASCAHIPQPPFYGDPKEHPDWLKSKQVRDRSIPFSDPQNITVISYYYLKCQECGVLFKSIGHRELCPECGERFNLPSGQDVIVFIIFFPLLAFQYIFGG